MATFGILLLLVGAAFYLMPSIIAFARGHNNKAAIAALNILLGWSVIGWVASLVWAMTSQKHETGVVNRAA